MNAPVPTPPDVTDHEFDHPLRAIPWVRKLPNNTWVAILLTAALSTVLGLLFAMGMRFPDESLGFGERLRGSWVYSFAIGYSIHAITKSFGPAIRIRLRKRPYFVRLVANVALWLGGAMMGFGIASTLMGQDSHRPDNTIVLMLVATVVLSIVTGLALRQQAFREMQREMFTERVKAARSEVARTLALSRLRLLQAQIEPHFLFNTLANVSSLIEVDAKKARVMLDQFTLLLRALLDQTRQSTTTLQKELQVAEAYLDVLKIRMGERLVYRIEVPSDLVSKEVPAMLLQPIVENAVKHGIEPRIHGGEICVSAKVDGDQLVLAVKDNGVGFVAHSTESIGLGAIRERLAVQFGETAKLDISRTEDEWTQVAIRIPMPV
jgi:signal transduction histidine kinase